jgi:peroxiredoxin
MAATPSTMLELGSPMPDFELPDVDGRTVSSDQFAGAPATLVVFLCPHCPFVRHTRLEIGRFGRDYQSQGLAMIAINSNDTGRYPEDGPDGMKNEIAAAGYTFAYLRDESQAVAKSFKAACTPDFFLFDGERKLVYRGQFDGSRPRNDVPVTGADLRAAADAVLAGRSPALDQKSSIGCNIKWKPGNEPPYF